MFLEFVAGRGLGLRGTGRVWLFHWPATSLCEVFVTLRDELSADVASVLCRVKIGFTKKGFDVVDWSDVDRFDINLDRGEIRVFFTLVDWRLSLSFLPFSRLQINAPVCGALNTNNYSLPSSDRDRGLVAPASRAVGSGIDRCILWSTHTSDPKMGTQVVTLSGAWR